MVGAQKENKPKMNFILQNKVTQGKFNKRLPAMGASSHTFDQGRSNSKLNNWVEEESKYGTQTSQISNNKIGKVSKLTMKNLQSFTK